MPSYSENDILVVGAGVAGLVVARELARAGKRVLVLERARGVGGRCATRRIEGVPVDFGTVFFHGSDPSFLAALAETPAKKLPGWPRTIHGAGRPCQPEAFAPQEERLAFVEGVSAFPKYLARDLDVKTSARVVSAVAEGRTIHLHLEGGGSASANTVIVALAAEQASSFFQAFTPHVFAIESIRTLLGMVKSLPCLTLIASYPNDVPKPAWDICYPEDSKILQLVVHESQKRPGPWTTLVYQAHPRFSRERIDDGDFPRALLAEAARLFGSWALEPLWMEPHRWRYARTDRGTELSAPMLLRLPSGARIGLAGEIFAPSGGVEAAFLSGQRLARRILAADNESEGEER